MDGLSQSELAELLDKARARWSSFTVEPDVFAAWVCERLPHVEQRAVRAADMYLACACASGDPAAIAEFEVAFGSAIDTILRRYRRASGELDELKQRVRVRMLVAEGERPAIIRQYAGRGALLSFVRGVATRTVLMFLRDESPPSSTGDELVATMADDTDVELTYLKQRYREHFRQAVELMIGRLEARQRTLLRYQLCDELTIDQIGAIYRVHRATAARWLAQARAKLIRDLHDELSKRLAVSPRELDDILYLVQSRLDVTIERLLRSRG